MRRTLGFLCAAALAAGTFGVQTAGAAPGGGQERGPAAAAIAALQQHPGAARAADGQRFEARTVQQDADGTTQERVYDVAWSGDRKPGADGKLPAVGNTVNVKEASYTNAIGAAALQAYWKDPDFDPSERAFYYVRVVEIPTPRWTTFDAKILGVKLPDDVPASIQERAYTSPIWYTPAG